MIRTSKAILTLLLLFSTGTIFAQVPDNSEIDTTQTYNPRGEYLLGVGPIVGGSAGGVGIVLDYNLFPNIGIQTGVGSGYYFESYFLSSRYYLLPGKISPFLSMGYAAWRGGNGVNQHFNNLYGSKKLGLQQGKFTHLMPLSIGIQFMSETGLATFITIDYIFSPAKFSGVLFGSTGFGWYF